MTEQGKSRGCLFYTGIAIAISIAVLLVASYLGYRYAKRLIHEFSGTQPVPVAATTLSETEINQARERVLNFSRALEQRTAVEPVSFTADEINGLIASHTNLVTVRGRLHISSLAGSNVLAEMSVPAEDLGFKPLQGRYVNASGVFIIGFSNGVLNVNAQSLSNQGQAFPNTFMGRIRPQNFAYRLNNDPQSKAVLSRLQDVRINDGKLVLIPKSSP